MHISRRLRCCLMTLMFVEIIVIVASVMQFINIVNKAASEDVNNAVLLTNSSIKFLLPHKGIRILTEHDFKHEVGKLLPTLPVAYWQNDKNYWNKYNETCPPFPSIDSIIFDNTYWQTLRTSQGTFYLYGAYMDNRKSSHASTVRILAVHDRIEPKLVTHCQLWFQNQTKAVVVRVSEYLYIWYTYWGYQENYRLQPYLISCRLPKKVQHLVPASVSLVENECDLATNNLRVNYNRPRKMKDFAVCVKELDFLQDISVRLVEWIELVRLMGADKIFFYELQVHPNITKVLDYYKNLGVVTVIPYTLPGSQLLNPLGLQHMYLKTPIFNKRQMDLITYNDCLYRNLHDHRWVVLLDIDEIIVPVKDNDWKQLMKRILPLSALPSVSYVAYHTYFLDLLRHDWQKDVPRYMHMLQHIYRTQNYSGPGYYVKAFHETDRVLTLHNHFPFSCLGGSCPLYWMQTEDARLHHYRNDCVPYMKKNCRLICENVERDTLVWRWSKPLISNVEKALHFLGFFKPSSNTLHSKTLITD